MPCAPFDPDSPLVTRIHPAHNVEPRCDGARPRLVILHYTGMASAEKAIDWLSREESRVSCHYVVDEMGRTTQLVPEALRAWHAGVSYWQGERDINSLSVGIEIQNPGHCDGYPDFPDAQIAAVAALTRDICARHSIAPEGVLAHSDVAIARKIDPGEKFPWARLARMGVGLWVEPAPVSGAPELEIASGTERDPQCVARARSLLARYGYDIAVEGAFDADMQKVVMAFQRHFRPQRVDGRLDHSTLTTLRRLIEKLESLRVIA